MEAYFQAFVNFEQNNRVKLLLMAKFTYNNTKNTSTSYTCFKLNCSYQPNVFIEKDIKPYSGLKTADTLIAKLQ